MNVLFFNGELIESGHDGKRERGGGREGAATTTAAAVVAEVEAAVEAAVEAELEVEAASFILGVGGTLAAAGFRGSLSTVAPGTKALPTRHSKPSANMVVLALSSYCLT